MKTILGTIIPKQAKGILYLCELNRKNHTIRVIKELLYTNGFAALTAYANIPNPESQLVTGKTYEELINDLTILHKHMSDPKWVEELEEYI